MSEQTSRFNVQLDAVHAAKLRALADRTHLPPGTVARSLLSTSLDQLDPDPASIVELLDAIPGARERAGEGRAQARRGEGVPLADL
jgi:hypothetical protein